MPYLTTSHTSSLILPFIFLCYFVWIVQKTLIVILISIKFEFEFIRDRLKYTYSTATLWNALQYGYGIEVRVIAFSSLRAFIMVIPIYTRFPTALSANKSFCSLSNNRRTARRRNLPHSEASELHTRRRCTIRAWVLYSSLVLFYHCTRPCRKVNLNRPLEYQLLGLIYGQFLRDK